MSYEYCSSTEGDESHSASSSEDIPDKVQTITPEEVIAKMKDQLDTLYLDVQDRTTELREVQKYVKRLETALFTDMKQMIESVSMTCDYNKADLKD